MRNAVVVRRFRGAFSLPHSRSCPREPAESRRGRLQTAAGCPPGTIRLVGGAHAGLPCPTRTSGILYTFFFSLFLRPRGAKPNKTDDICCFWPVRQEDYSTFTRCVEFLIFSPPFSLFWHGAVTGGKFSSILTTRGEVGGGGGRRAGMTISSIHFWPLSVILTPILPPTPSQPLCTACLWHVCMQCF